MSNIQDLINKWTKDGKGRPLLHSTEDAVYYGTLIAEDREKVTELRGYRSQVLTWIQIEKGKEQVDLDRVFNLAIQAQYYREAYEAAETIMKGGDHDTDR